MIVFFALATLYSNKESFKICVLSILTKSVKSGKTNAASWLFDTDVSLKSRDWPSIIQKFSLYSAKM